MKILILGGAGMLGHKVYQVFTKKYNTYVTFRNFSSKLNFLQIFDKNKIIENVDINDFQFPNLSGIYNISSEKISKYDLLQIIKKVYNLKVMVKPYLDFKFERSLDSTTYRKITDFVPTNWENMIKDMFKDYSLNRNNGIYNV